MNIYSVKKEINAERIEQDLFYLHSFYSPVIIEILPYVSQVIDDWDYDNSPMYDVYTDRLHIWKIIDKVYEKCSYLENFYRPVGEEDDEMNPSGHCISCRSGDSWLKNIVIMLVVGELRERRRRKWTKVES